MCCHGCKISHEQCPSPYSQSWVHSQRCPSPTWRPCSASVAFPHVNMNIFMLWTKAIPLLHPCLAGCSAVNDEWLYWGYTGVMLGRERQGLLNSGYKCWRWAELMEYYILHWSGRGGNSNRLIVPFNSEQSVPIPQNLKEVITYFLGIFKRHLSLKVPAWKGSLLISARFSLLLYDMGSWWMGARLEGS